MQAVRFAAVGRPAQIENVPTPSPGPGQASHRDWWRRRLPLGVDGADERNRATKSVTFTNSASESDSDPGGSRSLLFDFFRKSWDMSSSRPTLACAPAPPSAAARPLLSCEPLPGPSSVEAHELGAMRVEDVGGNSAPFAPRRQDHDYKPSGADVFRVVHQVPVLFSGSCRANQCSLQPLEYSMLCPSRVEAAQVFVAMEYVDGLPIETSVHQCVNGGGGMLAVRDRANDTVGRVRNESAFGSVGIHEFHFISEVSD